MCRVLSDGLHTIMAADAVASNTAVIKGRWQPARRRVAIIAGIAACDMGRVFAGRRVAIMTGAAGADDLRVVYGQCWGKYIGAVTVFANIAGLNMRGVFAGGLGAIVAVDAAARDIDVIEVRRYPASCRVTIVAGIATRDMGRVLSGSCDTIMTGAAGVRNLCVVDRVHGREFVGVVAVFADVGGRYVS